MDGKFPLLGPSPLLSSNKNTLFYEPPPNFYDVAFFICLLILTCLCLFERQLFVNCNHLTRFVFHCKNIASECKNSLIIILILKLLYIKLISKNNKYTECLIEFHCVTESYKCTFEASAGNKFPLMHIL